MTKSTVLTINLMQLAEAYLDHHLASGKSPRTQESYRERLMPFIRWCQLRSIDHATQVSITILESYQRYLGSYRKASGELLTVNGQLHRLRSLKQWFGWLLKQHHILYNPAELMVLPRAEKRLPVQVMSEEETRQVLDALDSQTPLGLRNRAILETFWSSGIRRMELANLMLNDINVGKGVLLVNQGKGNKDRVVPLGKNALNWIDHYLKTVRPTLARRQDSGHLFLTIRGGRLSGETLTQLSGHAIRQQAKLDKPGACHLFRHSMATQMLENGADTRHIQAILGHEKLDTTQIYTRVAIGHLKQVHNDTHPGNRITTKLRQKS